MRALRLKCILPPQLAVALTAAALALAPGLLAADDAAQGLLFLETAPKTAHVSLIFLPVDAEQVAAENAPSERRLLVTGTYSSGDRFAPEGFVIRRGDPTHPFPQGWDGLLLVDRAGRASVHDVSDVRHGGARYDLRDREARRAFVAVAETEALSAIQSHLLIREGALDLAPVLGAKRFRRRILFETDDGRLGVFDTSPRAMTLFEAAAALQHAISPRMALNLDMGTYDYCEESGAYDLHYCGVLRRESMDNLTNLIEIRFAADDGATR